jgi:ABC-type uncharacterized transport system, permease component
MLILLFRAFYESSPAAFPMPFSALVSYFWLQQSFLTLLAPWAYNTQIMDSVQDGTVAYELCRPADLYAMWFTRNVADRCAKVCLRGLPILIAACVIPEPYSFAPPPGVQNLLLFAASAALGSLAVVAVNMLVFISAFYTTSTQGMRLLFNTTAEFLCGGIIPLPFMPAGVRTVLAFLPLGSVENTPFLIYTGYYQSTAAVQGLCVQAAWILVLIAAGRAWLARSLRRVVVLGG